MNDTFTGPTKTEKIQQELFDREVQLRLALNLAGTGICEINLETETVSWDARLREIFDADFRSPNTTLAEISQMIHARDRERVRGEFNLALKERTPRYDTEFRIRRENDRSIRWIQASGQFLYAPHTKSGRIFFIAQDITPRKMEVEQAKESRAKISNLLNQIPQLVWTTTAKGQLIYANGRFLKFTSQDCKKRDRNWLHSIHPHDAHEVIGKWNAAITSGDEFEAEYRLCDSSGRYTWFLGRAVPLRDDSGNISEWFGTATNIHDRREAESRRARIQRKVSQLQLISASLATAHTPIEVAQIVVDQGLEAIDAISGFIALTQRQTDRLNILYANGFERAAVEDLKGLSLRSKSPVVDAILTRSPVFEKNTAGIPLLVQGEAIGALALTYKSGEPFPPERIGYLGILAEQCAQAIERARLFEAERTARRATESATKAKSQFLANMSHEIRTPMNAILGFSDLLADKTLTEAEREEYRRRIRMNGDQLMHLIDDVLDLSKVESGNIVIESVPFSITDLVRDVLSHTDSIAKQKGIRTRVVTHASVPNAIDSDPVRLRQILTNIIGNSIKFTDHGRIETRIEMQSWSETPAQSRLTIEIEDTGIGISPELHLQLFKPFAQGDSSVTRRFGGSGLGLVVSRGIAEAMGGTLDLVRSESGRGSIFRLAIPLTFKSLDPQIDMFADSLLSPPPHNSLHELSGINVLLVEDSYDNEMLIRAYLKGTGVDLHVAHNGAEAIDCATNQRFDVVFMDIQMPVMDGLEATRRLKSKNYDVPIVALSAHALPEEIERSISAGCHSHLTKPIMRKVLIDRIRSFAP